MKDIAIERRAFCLRGSVQGIGLRPLAFRLAKQYQLSGFIKNTAKNVLLEWQGLPLALDNATKELSDMLFPWSEAIHPFQVQSLQDEISFTILPSEGESPLFSLICPDLATCNACLAEMNDPKNRRFGYPFISCAHCGPRYTLCQSLPYDRHTTSMIDFAMCERCRKEYDSPSDRRYYAQTISCWDCGPTLTHSSLQDPVHATVHDLMAGNIVAIKGIGGFHLVALASHDTALRRLRERKHRPEKPFAVMVSSLEEARMLCQLSLLECSALTSAFAPIVIAKANPFCSLKISSLVAFQQAYLGIMLAYTPLHHRLLKAVGAPLVVTSANLRGEPICYQEDPVLLELADTVLTHDRKIVSPLEDSVVQEIDGKIRILRRARGYSPTQLAVEGLKPGWLSVGSHLKNTQAISLKDTMIISPHLGDLDSVESERRFKAQLEQFKRLAPIDNLVQDYHPHYGSTLLTCNTLNIHRYPHHLAHVTAVMAEHGLRPPVLGFAWDGLGMSDKGEWWGGETLVFEGTQARRVGSLIPIRLLGNEKALKEPRRVALSLVHTACDGKLPSELSFSRDFDQNEWRSLLHLMGCPALALSCSSMGRLFDGVSYLLGGPAKMSFEGQAAMWLEHLASLCKTNVGTYPVSFETNLDVLLMDWRPLIREIILDIQNSVPFETIAFKFHCWCANALLAQVKQFSFQSVVLSGGVFQNRILVEQACALLRKHRYTVYCAEKFPPHDGGLSVGQLYGMNLCA